jgi:SAM-dependent methyltransferase
MLRSAIFNTLRGASNYKARQWFKRQPWFAPVSKLLFGNGVYCDSYYRDVERMEKSSVEVVADWITHNLAPATVIDIGCGPGHQMKALKDLGVSVYGIDISPAALKITTHEKKLNASRFDLTDPTAKLPGTPYDLSLSCEVAEHLEEAHARTFVGHVISASDTVYLTAAEPDVLTGKGLNHFNEQPNDYWIKLFAERGYHLHEELTQAARTALTSRNVTSYLARPMIFKKTSPG